MFVALKPAIRKRKMLERKIVLAVLASLLAAAGSLQQQVMIFLNLLLGRRNQQVTFAHAVFINSGGNIARLRQTRRLARGSARGRLWRKAGRTAAWWDNLYSGKLPEEDWKKNLRMSREVFMSVVEKLRVFLTPKPSPRGSDTISVEKQLGVTLYYLKDQGSLVMTANAFGLATCTVSVVVRKVCAVITRELGPEYIRLPTKEEEMVRLLKKMEDKFGFPQAFGCVDGTHIAIKQPSDNPHDFFSYKMKYTINVQGVCDSSGLFLDVDVRWPGSLHDAKVFSYSRINRMLREGELPMMYKRMVPGYDKVPVLLLGDPAYPLLPFLMKEHTHPKNNAEVIFNNMLRAARNPIECAYGRLKARWQILNKRMDIGLKYVPSVIYACFVLHNICELNAMPVDADDVTRQIERERDNKQNTEPDRLYNINTAEGVYVRDVITLLFKEYLPHTYMH